MCLEKDGLQNYQLAETSKIFLGQAKNNYRMIHILQLFLNLEYRRIFSHQGQMVSKRRGKSRFLARETSVPSTRPINSAVFIYRMDLKQWFLFISKALLLSPSFFDILDSHGLRSDGVTEGKTKLKKWFPPNGTVVDGLLGDLVVLRFLKLFSFETGGGG